MMIAAMKWKDAYSLEEKLCQPRQHIKELRQDFANKAKTMIFPVIMYGCESWTVKKAEHQEIDAFEL